MRPAIGRIVSPSGLTTAAIRKHLRRCQHRTTANATDATRHKNRTIAILAFINLTGRLLVTGLRGLPNDMSELIHSAKLFANRSHDRIETHRNPAWQSFEVHLKSVAQLISSVSQDETMIAAAWLHEIVEGTRVTVGDIEREFGGAVAKIVGE